MKLVTMWRLKSSSYVALLSAGVCLAISVAGAATVSSNKSNQIRVEYVPPKNPSHHSIYERVKAERSLELIQQLLSPIRLPHPLLLKVSGCDGESNAGTMKVS
jgi:hypothetical protein